MFRHILSCIALSIYFFVALPCNAQENATDSPKTRAVAVERYFASVSMNELRVGMVEEMSKQMPPEERQDFSDFMNNDVRWADIETAAKKSLATHLTVDEITALAEFMEKPVGKSAMGKMKYYMADLMPIVQTEIKRALAARKAAQIPAK